MRERSKEQMTIRMKMNSAICKEERKHLQEMRNQEMSELHGKLKEVEERKVLEEIEE